MQNLGSCDQNSTDKFYYNNIKMGLLMYIYVVIITLATMVVQADPQNTSVDIHATLKDIFGDPCTTKDGKIGKCVMNSECKRHKAVAADSDGLSVMRIRSCINYLHVCCLVFPDPETKMDTNPVQEEKKGCGWRKPIGVLSEPFDDNVTQFGEFPWTVAIFRKEKKVVNGQDRETIKYVNGGSIIHPSVVLTGAHVVSTHRDLFIRAGEWDIQSRQEPYPHQDRAVDVVVIHPQFNRANLFNDIALLFLSKPVEYAPNVGVVCLPPQGYVVSEGAKCVSTGWGKNTFGRLGQYQTIMKKVQLPVVSNADCQSSLRQTRLGRYFSLSPTFMCAGGEMGKDTCQGDGGSPLVCPVNFDSDRYMQSGIVAWGIECGSTSPGVYTNVAVFRQWVDDTLKERGYDTSVYTY